MRRTMALLATAAMMLGLASQAAAETYTYELTGWSHTQTGNEAKYTPPIAGWTAPGADVNSSKIEIFDDGVNAPVLLTWQNHNVTDADFVSCDTTGACPIVQPPGTPAGMRYVTAAHVVLDTWVVVGGLPQAATSAVNHIPGPGHSSSIDFGTMTSISTTAPVGSTSEEGIFCEAGCALEATVGGAVFVVPGSFDLTCALDPTMRSVLNGGSSPTGCDSAAGLTETPDGDPPIYASGPPVALSTQTFGDITFHNGPNTMTTSPCPNENTGNSAPPETEASNGNDDCVFTFTNPPPGSPDPHQQWGRYEPPEALVRDPNDFDSVNAACALPANDGNWWCTGDGGATILAGLDPFKKDAGGLTGHRTASEVSVPVMAPIVAIGVLGGGLAMVGSYRLRHRRKES